MAELLTKWLSRDIEKELSGGIDRLILADKVKREEDEDGAKLPYEDDGSNLRIPVSYGFEKRRCAQIRKILRTRPRFEVVLSDSHVSIPANLTSSCVKHFESQHKRRIFDETENGIISIRKFNVVATTIGEPTWHISLEVESMEWQGNFESQFGNPESIREKPDIEAQLKTLSEFRHYGAGTAMVSQETADTPGNRDLEALPETTEVVEDDNMESSALYTQMQPSMQRPVSRRGNFNATKRRSIGGVNRDSPTLLGDVRSAPMDEEEEDQPREAPQVKAVDRLLSLLRAGGQASNRANVSSDFIHANPQRNGFTPTSRKHSEDSANGFVSTSRRSSEEGVNVQGSPSVRPIPIRRSPPKSSPPPSIPFSNEAHGEVQPSQQPLHEATYTPETISIPAWKDGHSKIQDQCSFLLGQAAILNRDFSLFPSLPGKKFPHPNIPTPLLVSLNRLADEGGGQDLGEQDHAPNVSEEDSHIEQDRDSEYDSSSSSGASDSAGSVISGWEESSPPRPPAHLLAGLPPDSSAPVVETLGSNALKRMSRPVAHSQTTLHPDSSALQEESPARRAPSGLSQATPIELTKSDSDDVGAPGRTQISIAESEAPGNEAVPSSPPEPGSQTGRASSPERRDISDSDEEMEFAIPEVLETSKMETNSASQATSTSLQHREARGVPELQVKETPQLPGHRKVQRDLAKPSSSWSPVRQRSSGQTTSSTSVIPSTYAEPRGQLNARLISTKRASAMIDLSSDADPIMIDEQLNEEINAASQRPPPEVKSPSPSEAKAPFNSNHSPMLPHVSSSNPGSLVKRKAADLPAGFNSSKKPRSAGLGLPRESEMVNGDNMAPPMTIREQRRQKLNSYNTTGPGRAEEHLLPSPKFATNRKESNGLVDKHDSRPNHPPSTTRWPPRSDNASPKDIRRGSERVLHDDHRSPGVEQAPSNTATHKISRPANRSAAMETATTNLTEPSQSPGAIVFSKFSQAYPEYKGTMKQFRGMCKQIQKLEDERKKLPRLMWDDYVIRYEMEFVEYRNDCFENGDEPVSYYNFYDSIKEHKFMKQILNPEGLKSVLDQTSNTSTSTSTALNLPVRRSPTSPAQSSNPKRTRKSVPWEPSSTAPAQSGPPRMSLPSASSQQPRSKPIPCLADDKDDRPKTTNRIAGRVDEEDRSRATTTTHGQVDERGLPHGAVESHEAQDAAEPEDGHIEIEMHEDPNSNFRQFVRGYASLATVKGRLGEPDSEGFLRPQRAKRIDVMAWPIGFKR